MRPSAPNVLSPVAAGPNGGGRKLPSSSRPIALFSRQVPRIRGSIVAMWISPACLTGEVYALASGDAAARRADDSMTGRGAIGIFRVLPRARDEVRIDARNR